jgi:hypothetical protein
MSATMEMIYYIVLFVLGVSFLISLFLHAYDEQKPQEEYEHNDVLNNSNSSNIYER